MDQLELIVQVLLVQKPPEYIPAEFKGEISHIRRMINSLNYAFRKMKSDGTLSSYQEYTFSLFSKLASLLQETKIASSDGTINVSLWDSLDNGSVLFIMLKSKQQTWILSKANPFFSLDPNVGLRFTSESLGMQLLVQIRMIRAEIDRLTAETTFSESVKRWFFNDSLGSLDQMRVDLETRYNSQRIQVPSYDAKMLDW